MGSDHESIVFDSVTTQPRDVNVEILLVGGHRHAVNLASDSPVLQNLVAALTTKLQGSAEQNPTFFQIPLDRGQSALSFSDRDLAAITTSPPVLVHTGEPVLRLRRDAAPREVQAPATPDIVRSHWVQIDNVLSPDAAGRLLDFALGQEAQLTASSVTTEEAGYRKSRVLYDFPEFSEPLLNKVRAYLPSVLRELSVPPFHVAQVECQLTAHNDGDYFKVHDDSGSDDTANRELTYVYYFHREPKRYAGGELLLYDSRIENGHYVRHESFSVVEPRHNSIIFFLSRCHHEVLPVQCPSQEFGDSRFTVNGWIRRDG